MADKKKGMEIVFPMTVAANLKNVRDSLDKIRGAVSKEQVTLKVNIPSTIGKSLIGTTGKAQEEFFKGIQEAVGDVGKLTQKYVTLKDTRGKIHKVFMQETKEFRDANGNMIRDVTALRGAEEKLQDRLERGWERVGGGEAQSNFRKQTEMTEAALNRELKAVEANSLSAETFLKKSTNMRGPQVKAAQEAARAVLAEGEALRKASPKADDYAEKVQRARKANEEFRTSLGAVQAGANVFQSFATRIGNALQQTLAYSLSIGLVYKAQRLLNDAIRYTIDLNTEMVKIQVLQVEGAMTPEDINALADSYNKLGQEMAASTLEIAKGSVEWLRQGRTVTETAELMRSSLMLSKLGAMSAADATNYLTSITNAFKIEVGDTVGVVDKLIAVDNIAATSAGELATAMRYTSESAAIAGVTMDQLVSYIGVVSTVTRQNAEMIGQAFKTMFARMTLIEGGGVDEDKMTISKVEKVLRKVNITIRDVNGNFRNMGDVLEDIGARWETLGERERMEIAIAIGGVRQKEPFLVLMNNMNKALEYQTSETEAAGLAQQRYGIYLESVEAKQAKLTAQMQELYMKTINSETVKTVLDLASAIVGLMNSMGGLIPILSTLVGLMIMFNQQAILGFLNKVDDFIANLISLQFTLIEVEGAETGAAAGAALFETALGPVGLALIAITAIMVGYHAIMAHNKKVHEEAAKAVDDYVKSLDEFKDAVASGVDTISQLRDILAIPEAKRTTDQLEQLNTLFNKLYELLPGLKDWKFANGQPYLEESALQALHLRDALEQTITGTEEDTKKTVTGIKDQIEQYSNLTFEISRLAKKRELLNLLAVKFGDTEKHNAQEAYDFVNQLDKTNWTPGMLKALEEVRNVITDESKGWGGMLTDTFSEDLHQMVVDAGRDFDHDSQARVELGNAIKKVLSGVMEDMSPLGRSIWQRILGITGIDEWLNTVEAEARSKVPEVANRLGLREELGIAQERRKAEALTEQIDLYQTLADRINSVSELQDKWNKITEDGTATNIDYEQGLKDINDKIAKLNEEGANLPVADITDFVNEAGNLDTGAIDRYIDSLYEAIGNSEDLADVTRDDLKASLLDLLDTARGTSDELVDIGYKNAQMTQAQFNAFVDTVSSSMWDLVSNEGAMLLDMNGQEITSAENLKIALENHLISFDDFIAQMVSQGISAISILLDYMDAAMANVKGLTPYKPTQPSFGGAGGGGAEDAKRKAYEDEIKAIEDTIKRLQKKKKEWQDQLNDFKDYIALQKESLKRDKEEADFQEELAKKHKNLGKLKAELALLDMDNSEEAQKRKLELQDQIANSEEDITKDVEDRKYDLQIQALEDVQKAFEDMIQAQIDALDKEIEQWNDQKDAIQDNIQALAGSGGGGAGASLSNAYVTTRAIAEAMTDAIISKHKALLTQTGLNRDDIIGIAEDSVNSAPDAVTAWTEFVHKMEHLDEVVRRTRENLGKIHETGNTGGAGTGQNYGSINEHYGGIAETHHQGMFAGNLMSNEIFAKLLKGEYVATEGQMDNFLKNILPKIMSKQAIIKPPTQTFQGGDIKFDMKIFVNGSFDKKVLPELKKQMMKDVVKALENRGFRRSANSFMN